MDLDRYQTREDIEWRMYGLSTGSIRHQTLHELSDGLSEVNSQALSSYFQD